MAPSRRKGVSKAAAARRQWKVGDLVLAKVKGFPAWPATVSEPEKWGYSADWKKVLVHFFGTQQIAFCNPADVEAFTEEKKQSLLVKHQGRGADFVRAVKEIIDSYEKLRQHNQVDGPSIGNKDALKDGVNLVDSSAQTGLKDLAQIAEETHDMLIETLDSTACVDKPGTANDAPVAAEADALPDKETSSGQSAEKATVNTTPIITTYTSRKRSGGLRSRKFVTQKAPTESVQRSSRVESCRLQNLTLPCNDASIPAGGISTNLIEDVPSKRKRRTRKSPDAFERNDVDSSAFLSNGSVEDNGSEIVTVESEAMSLNDGSTMDSGCKLEQSESVAECLEEDVELSKRLDFQIKAVIVKKKRKPIRKRVANGTVEPPARLDMEPDLEAVVHDPGQNSQDGNGRHFRDDGDEHLPLLKRARVRMGKPSNEDGESISVSWTEKSLTEVTVSSPVEVAPSLKCNDDSIVDRDSSAVKGPSDNESPSRDSTEIPGDGPQLEKVEQNQSFYCSAEGEATLPPSKRLHRAMEAMSANAAAEKDIACVSKSSVMKASINGCCVPSLRRSSPLVIEAKEGNNLEQQSMDSSRKSAGFCRSLNTLEDSSKGLVETDTCSQHIDSYDVGKPKLCKDCPEAMRSIDSKALSSLTFNTHNVQIGIETQSAEHASPNLDRRQDSPRLNLDSWDQLLTWEHESDSQNTDFIEFQAVNHAKKHDVLENSITSVDVDSRTDGATKVSPQNGEEVLHVCAEGTFCSNTMPSRSQIDENSLVNGMYLVVKDDDHLERRKDTNSVCISNNIEAGKDVSCVRLSPSSADGVDSPAQMSPLNTSICHMSTSESANFVLNNGCCSPNAHLQDKKEICALVTDEEEKSESAISHRPKSAGRSSSTAEAHAALLSFEAMLGTLTRTKESIGQATRIAIDCAKLGVSAKVVEILARYLEVESSLHRRVDLFFLVDSIMQFSRGLKGDFGGIYPSAIQEVLPRLLLATAPPGSIAQENRRQCLKVLRLWLERKILPESFIREHMRDLDSWSGPSAGLYSRRSARTERALDDPVRDMEGMLVDEYGSNSSFLLLGFCMPPMLKDEDEEHDSDGGTFEAVTPEHNSEEMEAIPATEKGRHILEEVDGELEMEDVAPACDVEMSSTNGAPAVIAAQATQDRFVQHFPLPYAPPLPQDVPPSSPPLPSSPPPPPPPPPPSVPPAPILVPLPRTCSRPPYANAVDSKHYYNMWDDLPQQSAHQSVPLRLNSSIPSSMHYHAPKSRDHKMPTQGLDSTSFPVRSANNLQSDSPSLHHKAYPPRPPHPAPSNQFSYFETGQHMKSRRDYPPPSYPHRSHSTWNFDEGNFYNNGGNFYNEHERINPAPYEISESRTFPAHRYSGPRYPDKVKSSYGPGSHGPPREQTRSMNQEWHFPHRAMHHRNSVPFRPPPDAGFPGVSRVPSVWRSR
ncbi:Tudor/PWWP/MBT domain-containing protein putative isoform 2 [Tripterygium wilfordii]|uniref:Tudor/PWWP/MBT domain-containing protein putative isoform 2 n=1 Tax=Tripterygium wilfordii TaxID=458696 RepID=A0A7J7CFT8_TRIWF|nr:protein HUA2-LIKE 3 isoform X1 [Tripterygium wilfordii]KAF5732747.1 Tudor/PWWP/MBT domain-containing protein putative isoform 2 [Tripterygium wilfordii]